MAPPRKRKVQAAADELELDGLDATEDHVRRAEMRAGRRGPARRAFPETVSRRKPTMTARLVFGLPRVQTGFVLASLLAWSARAPAETLDVGRGKPFARIQDALAGAKPGDEILVHALPDGKPYPQEALLVRTPRVSFRAKVGPEGARVRIDGAGFEYSGAGRVPRAIFQFDPGADGCLVEGFELTGARNESSNGAGIRINQASDVTIRNCEIRGCDMGAMSNGEAGKGSARNQHFELCLVRDNGSKSDPGYNHNFYLGGTSVTLRGCEVRSSTTGHNFKSRAHLNWIECCYIHDSANRELDLVDSAGNTDIPGSHTVLLGNIIVKAKGMSGNRTVIHFGQDGGKDHQGTLFLAHNTIVTPYIAPVVELSAPGAGAVLHNNIVWDASAGQRGQVLALARGGAKLDSARGSHNWIGAHFSLPAGAGFAAGNLVASAKDDAPSAGPPFVDPGRGDFRLRAVKGCRLIDSGVAWDKLELPARPGPAESKGRAEEPKGGPEKSNVRIELFEYLHPLGVQARRADGKPDLGAHEGA
jgi:hypothetical protein